MKPAVETDLPAGAEDRASLIARHWAAQGTPFFAAKVALTLDGRTATRTGDSQWITGEGARADVMRWRRAFPAIAVGAGTVLADNPRLTARIAPQPDWCPLRFVFDGRLRTGAGPVLPHVYADEFRARTIVVTTAQADRAARRRLEKQGVQLWIFDTATPRVPVADFRQRCAEERISGVYLECGRELVSQFLGDRQLDYLFIYRGSLLLADDGATPGFSGLRTDTLAGALRLTGAQHEAFEGDLLTRGYLAYPERLVREEISPSLGSPLSRTGG